MNNRVATLGYGYHLPESILMLELAVKDQQKVSVRKACIEQWPQPSTTNKEKMWNHLARRYFSFDGDTIVQTPFIVLYGALESDAKKLELIFYQLCQTTPLLLEVLRALTRDTLLDTGTASFTKFHLDQILESQFGHVAKSTSERVRQILRESGRLRMDGKNYVATSACPCDVVLGFGLFADAERYGWRSPSTAIVISESDVTATFLCNRPQLMGGLDRLAKLGHCDFHTHGNTDQIQLNHNSVQEFVNAWIG